MGFAKLTPEELNRLDKQVLVTIISSLQARLNILVRRNCTRIFIIGILLSVVQYTKN